MNGKERERDENGSYTIYGSSRSGRKDAMQGAMFFGGSLVKRKRETLRKRERERETLRWYEW